MTLLELLIAMGIGLLVSAMALTAYFGANKAQAVTVGTHMLATSGQKSVAAIYRNLNGARRIYDRSAATDKFLNRIPIQGLGGGDTPAVIRTPAVPSEMVLPRVVSNGSFATQLVDGAGVITNNVKYDQASAGNALFFLAKDPKVFIRESGASTVQATAFATKDYFVQLYRLHFYFLARRPLGTGARPVRGTDAFTFQLMHWDSLPYVDRQDLETWMAGLMKAIGGSAAAKTYIDAKLAALSAVYDGAIDAGELDPDTALFDLAKASTSDYTHLKAKATTTLLTSGHYAKAIQSEMRGNFGESFVAFNTENGPSASIVGVPIRSLSDTDNTNRVPNYADATTGIPYGFEVMVAGSPTSRRVLMHLTLAARTQPGNVLMAQSIQQVAQVYEY
jgi:hypothetical protein